MTRPPTDPTAGIRPDGPPWMAHPDPTRRYLAHEVVQPVDRWEHIAYRVAEVTVALGCLAVLGYAFFWWLPA